MRKLMKPKMQNNPQQADRKGERGAALLTTLLISMLVLAAGMALVTSTSLSSTTSIDATAESKLTRLLKPDSTLR